MSETTLEFITLRQPERIRQRIKRLRYIRDLRTGAFAPFRAQVVAADVYREKVLLARTLLSGPLFFTVERYYRFRFEAAVEALREELRGPVVRRDGSRTEGANLAELIALLEERVPALAQTQFFHGGAPSPATALAMLLQYATIWDSLYATAVMAGIHQVETNHLIDAIRALHVLTVLRLENLKTPAPETWPYFDFDGYEAMLPGNLLAYTRLV
ncbi:hypothetical protein [Amaricoccus sp.]|uniref:hypothetical protein n=1 Tax=Amaricoccus sp. TaxID=1872485 RepID=UPI002623E7E9|nr:hypothetical protein [Amaricoccus sp.]HRO10271.1 hypothetical protein [Amaricoccus sp.]